MPANNEADKMSTPELEQQLIDMQTQLAFQEDTIQSLNDVVALQQQDILQLKQQVVGLLEDLKELLDNSSGAGGGGGSLFDERPPHY